MDHAVKTFQHYGAVNGNGQAGAATYFGFLSFFPILARLLRGRLGRQGLPRRPARPGGHHQPALPGIVGKGENQISIDTFEKYAGTIGLIGLFGVLYSGLGWLSGMRDALESVFQPAAGAAQPRPRQDPRPADAGGHRHHPAGLRRGLRDGLGLLRLLLGWVGLGDSVVAAVLLPLLGLVLGVAATTVLFFAMYRLLAQPGLPRKAVLEGAVLGAVGFEVKYLARLPDGRHQERARRAGVRGGADPAGLDQLLQPGHDVRPRTPTPPPRRSGAAPRRPRSPRSRWSRSAPPPYRWAGRRTAVAARCSRE